MTFALSALALFAALYLAVVAALPMLALAARPLLTQLLPADFCGPDGWLIDTTTGRGVLDYGRRLGPG